MELTIEKIQECRKVKEFLDDVCSRYFEAHTYEWEIYSGWEFSDEHPEHIVINYAYFDWRGEYEAGEKVVPMDVLIEFSKKLNKIELCSRRLKSLSQHLRVHITQ